MNDARMKINVTKLEGEPFKFGRHTFIFTHIPKCGGTSLHRTFEAIFGDGYAWGPNFRKLRRAPIQAEECRKLHGGGGHVNFGCDPLTRDPERNFVYFTVLRNPVDRFLSFHRHIIDHPAHRLSKLYPKAREMNPLEFATLIHEAKDPESGNRQSIMLTARENAEPDEVIEHVEKNYSIVGLLERMDILLEELQKIFPNFTINQHRLNSSRARHEAPELVRLESYLRDVNARDFALYEHFAQKS